MIGDFIVEGSATQGTADYALGGAYGVFSTWRSQKANGSTNFYVAKTLSTSPNGQKYEAGYGALTYGSPDVLARTTVLRSSNANSKIVWQSTDVYVVYSVALLDIIGIIVFGAGFAARPAWAQQGLVWRDISAGWGTRAIDKLFNGTIDVEIGRYEGAGLYAASQRAKFEDKGAANYTMVATDVGKVLGFDCTAAVRVLTMLDEDAAGMGHGAYVFVYPYGSTTNGVTFTPGGDDTTELATAPPKRITRFQWDGARQVWVADYVPPAAMVAGVRQTVAAGPVDTAGLPTFLPSTNAALSITSQNVSSSAPLVATSANGWSPTTGLPVDAIGYSTANLTWGGLTLNRAAATPNFLYGTISAAGVITPASTILAPIYQWGGTPAVTAGQITFNIAEMKCYLGNGATAPQTNLVVFGEAATDATTVISTVAYAYNGRYDSGFTATLPAKLTATAKSHNLGICPAIVDFIAENTTTDNGYAVGEQIHIASMPATDSSNTVYFPNLLSATTKTITVVSGNGTSVAWTAFNKGTNINTALTIASWKWKVIGQRGW